MDAITCAAPPALLPCSFADAAIARALHFSLSSGRRSPVPDPPSILADLDARSATTAPPAFCVPAPPLPAPPARCRLGPAAGRAGKRRPRPSKRVPTTYISADAATFRLMVQQVTGADPDPQAYADDDAGLGLLLPPFGVEHLQLPSSDSDPAAAAAHVAAYVLARPEAAAEQPCFPTLDSWNVMCDNN